MVEEYKKVEGRWKSTCMIDMGIYINGGLSDAAYGFLHVKREDLRPTMHRCRTVKYI